MSRPYVDGIGFYTPGYDPDAFLLRQRNMENLQRKVEEFYRRNTQITVDELTKRLDALYRYDTPRVRNKAYSLYHSHEGHDEEPSVLEEILRQLKHYYKNRNLTDRNYYYNPKYVY